MNKIGSVSTLLLKVIVFVLLTLTPIAILFKPYYPNAGYGLYPAVFEDPKYLLKAFFIATGLIGVALAVVSIILYLLFTRPHQKPQIVLHLSMTICAIALGLYVFPYCVNGIFQASLGNANFGDFDPTSLMPTIWIGEIWCDIAFLFFPIQIFVSAILILMTMSMITRKNLTRRQTLQIALFLIVTVLSFVILPGYLNWIMD